MTRSKASPAIDQIQSIAARTIGLIDCLITAALAEMGYRLRYFRLDAFDGKFPGFTLAS